MGNPIIGKYAKSIKVYTGLPTKVEIIGQTRYEEQEYDLTLGTSYNNGIQVDLLSLNNSMEFYLQSGNDWFEKVPIVGRRWSDLKFIKNIDKMVTIIHMGQNQMNTFNAEDFPETRKDYIITALFGISSIPIGQSQDLYNKMRRLMFREHGMGAIHNIYIESTKNDVFGRYLGF